MRRYGKSLIQFDLISTEELNKIAEDFIRKAGALPAFLGYKGYPKSVCISINDEVVHGINI